MDTKTTLNFDKVQHFALNGIPALVGYGAAIALGYPQHRKSVGMGVALVAAYGKELWDKQRPLQHTSDGADFVAGMVGAVCTLEILP